MWARGANNLLGPFKKDFKPQNRLLFSTLQPNGLCKFNMTNNYANMIKFGKNNSTIITFKRDFHSTRIHQYCENVQREKFNYKDVKLVMPFYTRLGLQPEDSIETIRAKYKSLIAESKKKLKGQELEAEIESYSEAFEVVLKHYEVTNAKPLPPPPTPARDPTEDVDIGSLDVDENAPRFTEESKAHRQKLKNKGNEDEEYSPLEEESNSEDVFEKIGKKKTEKTTTPKPKKGPSKIKEYLLKLKERRNKPTPENKDLQDPEKEGSELPKSLPPLNPALFIDRVQIFFRTSFFIVSEIFHFFIPIKTEWFQLPSPDVTKFILTHPNDGRELLLENKYRMERGLDPVTWDDIDAEWHASLIDLAYKSEAEKEELVNILKTLPLEYRPRPPGVTEEEAEQWFRERQLEAEKSRREAPKEKEIEKGQEPVYTTAPPVEFIEREIKYVKPLLWLILVLALIFLINRNNDKAWNSVAKREEYLAKNRKFWMDYYDKPPLLKQQ